MVFIVDVVAFGEKKCDEALLVLRGSLYQEIVSVPAGTCNSYL